MVALAKAGWQVTGIDIAKRAIAAAQKAADKHEVDVELEVADAAKWQPEGNYDLVLSSFALPEGGDRATVFAMMRGSLAPGGTVALKEFDSSMSVRDFFRNMDLVTVEELREAFGELDIVRAEVVDTPVHDHDGSGANAGENWTAALFHAQRR